MSTGSVSALDLVGTESNNFNVGTIRAVNGGIFLIGGTSLNNTNGLIVAENASEVQYSGSTIVGGTLDSNGTGLNRVTGTSTFVSFENTGLFSVNNAVLAELQGAITNSGTMLLNAGGNLTDFRLNSDVLLTGGGELTTSNSPNNRIYGTNANRRMTNASDHVIHGVGQIGVNSALFLTNEGLIEADVDGSALVLDLVGTNANNFNTATLRASNGGILQIGGTDLNNSGGLIVAEDGSEVQYSGSVIVGGTLDTNDTGVNRVTGGSTFVGIENTGLFVVNNAVMSELHGTMTNSGTMLLNAGGNSTDFRLNADVTFTGGGELSMSDSPNNRIYGINANRMLTNDAGHLIRGSGQIGVNSALFLTNNGVIRADQVSALTIDLIGSEANNQNNELIESINGATLHIGGTGLNNVNGVIRAGMPLSSISAAPPSSAESSIQMALVWCDAPGARR